MCRIENCVCSFFRWFFFFARCYSSLILKMLFVVTLAYDRFPLTLTRLLSSHILCLVSCAWCIIGFDLQKEVKITCIQLRIDAVWCSKRVPTWNKHNTDVSTRFF